MPKTTTTFVCRECGGESLRWAGQCPHCRAWNTLEEFTVRAAPRSAGARPTTGLKPLGATARAVPVTELTAGENGRLRLEWDELNRVLGGGLVPGSVTLIAGEPGVGKSTLLMHLADQLARKGHPVVYATGEESADQVRLRAGRLGALSERLLILAENDLEAIEAAIAGVDPPPRALIVDSIQTIYDPGVDSSAGSVTQVRACAAQLIARAKAVGLPTILVGHVTKEGAIAGPRVLEHMVDTVLYLEGERRLDLRILRANKNRFGSTDEIGVFQMAAEGMAEVADPSGLLLEQAATEVAGTVVVPIIEGTRPLLIEMQTLIGEAVVTMPRRSANGVDPNRLNMLLAVLAQRGGVSIGARDVYANVAGGIRITETAADLGLALSLASNHLTKPMADGCVVIGELGLTGEVRRVAHLDRRLAEAARRGFTRAIIPRLGRSASVRPAGLELLEVRDLADALNTAFPRHIRSATSLGAPAG
ncbi:MAG TPA: DNA repair protein RadA [Candidatus Dormibacteraeota bacterium]